MVSEISVHHWGPYYYEGILLLGFVFGVPYSRKPHSNTTIMRVFNVGRPGGLREEIIWVLVEELQLSNRYKSTTLSIT